MADDLLVIPAQTMARDIGGTSILPMGSLFEGAMFLVFEVLVLRVARGPRRDGGVDASPSHEHGVTCHFGSGPRPRPARGTGR